MVHSIFLPFSVMGPALTRSSFVEMPTGGACGERIDGKHGEYRDPLDQETVLAGTVFQRYGYFSDIGVDGEVLGKLDVVIFNG